MKRIIKLLSFLACLSAMPGLMLMGCLTDDQAANGGIEESDIYAEESEDSATPTAGTMEKDGTTTPECEKWNAKKNKNKTSKQYKAMLEKCKKVPAEKISSEKKALKKKVAAPGQHLKKKKKKN